MLAATMRSSRRTLLNVALGVPALIVLLAVLYSLGMAALEGDPRTFSESLQWATETLTTTGYGADNRWSHPAMIGLVVVTQFGGLALTFVVFSLVVVPFFEERFEGKLPRDIPKVGGYVLVYRYGPAVSTLVAELERTKVKVVILEEDEAVARRLVERGHTVVYAQIAAEDVEPSLYVRARSIVVAGTDQENAGVILSARQLGFEGDILALAERPLHRRPMVLAGATAVYTPLHILAAAMASLGSERVSPRLVGMARVRGHLHSIEVRIAPASELAGKTLAESAIRSRTGATVIGRWKDGEFETGLSANTQLEPGNLLVAVGGERSIEQLGQLATPLPASGPVVVCGFGEVGRKLVELLTDAGERVVVIEREAPAAPIEGVEFVIGDVLEQPTLKKASVLDARSVILALGDDSMTLFAATVVRDFASGVPIVARVDRAEHVERVHRVGVDFALSLSQVAAELLAQQLLGADWISLEARVKLVRVKPGALVGEDPSRSNVGAQTGCSIVAVERGDEVTVDFREGFTIEDEDVVHVAGPEQGFDRYYKAFPGAR